MTLSQKLAQFALSFRLENADPKAVATAKAHIADGVACVMLGFRAKPVVEGVALLETYGGPPVSTIIGWEGRKTDPANAAMLNGISGHFYDMDDISKSMRGHTTAILLPVILSLGEATGASGKEALTAFMAGAEVAGALGRGFAPPNYDKGWNPTSTIGIFGSTVTAGILLGLTQEQLVNALGLAATESGGFKANYGTLAKDVGMGRIPAKAIFCAEMAKRGMTASPAIFEGADGFSQATTKNGMDEEAVLAAMESGVSDFVSPGLIMKPYPCCRGVHNGIDGVLTLMKQHKFSAEDVERVRFRVEPIVKDADRYPRPKTPDEGKFSLAYCAAIALQHGEVTVDDFMGESIQETRVFPLMDRMEEEIDTSFTDSKSGIETIITLKTGETHRYRGHYAKGDPNNPMNEEERTRKFMQCAGRVLLPQQASAVKERLDQLETLGSIAELINMLG